MSATAPTSPVLRVDAGGDGFDPPAGPLPAPRPDVTLAETVLAGVRAGDVRFVEGRRARAGRVTDAFISTATADASGAPRRQLTLRCAPAPYDPAALRAAPAAAVAPGAARAVLDAYFDALAAGDLEAAAARFAEDCVYAHPPYRAGQPRHTFLGRRALLDGWRAWRGAIAGRPRIAVCVQEGALAFVEGVAGDGTFLSSVLLGADERIQRYVAVYRRPIVPSA